MLDFDETTTDAPDPSPVPAETVEQVEEVEEVQAESPAEEGSEDPKTEEDKAEGESSVIRQMRKQIKNLQKQINATQRVAQPTQPVQPIARENFENDESYVEALVERQVNQVIPQRQSQDLFAQKFEEAKKTHADFEEALSDIDHVLFTPQAESALRQAVETLPFGSDVLYHIAKNPDLAEEIALLPPGAFAAKLGDLHGDIRRDKTQVKKTSAAPKPISPVKPAGSSEKSYDDMPYEDFVRQRAKDKKAHNLRFVVK